MLLMVERGIRGGISDTIHRYAKTYHKCMKEHHKNKESLYLKHWDVNNLYGWAMKQNLPVNNFQQIEDTSKCNEDFIKNCGKETDERYFFDVDAQYPGHMNSLA